MSVTEIGSQQSRYARLSDRFKSLWTYHQFAAGVFKNFLGAPVPYNVNFNRLFEDVKAIGAALEFPQSADVTPSIVTCDALLDSATGLMLEADDRIAASLLRRFFERLKRQDDRIIHFLIKFYLYSDAVEGDRRDKLDFLFTRIGEDLIADRGEYASRDSLEFREQIINLVAVARGVDAPQREIVAHIRAIRSLREDILRATTFEQLTEHNLLRNARTFKHRVGDLYFHPDVLLAIVELNVATKNRFIKLYRAEEFRILEDAQKLMKHGHAIERNFGESNPELVIEIARFRQFKEQFDDLRAQSNVKHDIINRLTASMNNILTQLDRGLASEELVTQELPESFFSDAQQLETVTERFGRDEMLLPLLLRIAAAIDASSDQMAPEQTADAAGVRELRIEPWEIAAYQKVFDRRDAEVPEDSEELWMLFLRAAALRVKVDEEATILATALTAGVRPDGQLLSRAKQSLDAAKEFDEVFGDYLREPMYFKNAKILHQLYRSRFRLLRAFSGLWLIYDKHS